MSASGGGEGTGSNGSGGTVGGKDSSRKGGGRHDATGIAPAPAGAR